MELPILWQGGMLAHEIPVLPVWYATLRAEWWCDEGAKRVGPTTGEPTFRMRHSSTVPAPALDGQARDMSLLIAFLQTLGLPQEVKVSSEKKALSLAKAKLGKVLAQKINRTVQHHMTKLRETEDLLAAKQVELAEVEAEYRAPRSKRFSPTQSVAASVEPHFDNMSQDGAPGDDMDQSAREAEPQVRHDVSDGKGRCGSALPATTDLAGRPLVLLSVGLVESGIARSQVWTSVAGSLTCKLSLSARRPRQLHTGDKSKRRTTSVTEARGTVWVILSALGGFLFRVGHEGEQRKKR